MTQITDLMRTGRGLCASFDPAAGPERAAAFKADVERLFTDAVTVEHLPADPPPAEFRATWKGGHALIVEFGDEEIYGRCQCGTSFGSATPDKPLDDFGMAWERHVMTELPADPPPMERKPAPDWDALLGVLKLSVRVHNCLWGPGDMDTVGDLLMHSADELMAIRNFGPNALAEVRDVLAAHGLELKS